MRLLILIFLFPFIAQGQIVRTHPYYRPAASSCNYLIDCYPSAIAAYSVSRKLNTSYSGSLFRVRRSSDNTEQDIGVYGSGNLDTASLKTFVGTGVTDYGYVVTLYDQSGNGNNATQSTSGNQPRIVNAGVIDRLNGLPSLYFDGASPGDQFLASAMANRSRLDAYFITSSSDNQYLHFYDIDNSGNFGYAVSSGSGSTSLYGNFGTPSLYANNTLFSGTTRGDVYTTLNGTKIVTIQNAVTTSSGWVSNGFKMFGYSVFQFQGYCPEMIFWASDQSGNRSGIISNMNTYYSIY